MASQLPSQDPYTWSVDQVVAYFCASPFASAFQPADMALLATTLRQNDISGDVLLTDVDKETLRTDFGVRSFGLRARIHRAILAMRAASPAYAEYVQEQQDREQSRGGDTPHALVAASATAPFFSQSRVPSPAVWHMPSQQPQYPPHPPSSSQPLAASAIQTPTPRRQTLGLRESGGDGGMLAMTQPLPVRPAAEAASPVPLRLPAPPTPIPAFTPPSIAHPQSPPPPAQPRQDQTTSTPAAAGSVVPAPVPRDAEGELNDRADSPRKRRRLDPSLLQTTRQSSSKGKGRMSKQKEHYLPSQKVLLENVFSSRGGGGGGDDDDDESASDDDTFVLVGNACPAGQRRFVSRAMRRYLCEPPQQIQARGQAAIARFPFRNQIQAPSTRAFFTLYRQRPTNGSSRMAGNARRVVVTREPLEDWPELQDLQEDPYHAYLLSKYAPRPDEQEEPLPAFGDSGSEGGYDSDLMQEIEDEKEEQRRLGGASAVSDAASVGLTPADIDTIVDECVRTFEERFRKYKLPTYQCKARALWRRAQRNGSVAADVSRAKQQIHHLTHRLSILKKRIHENTWFGASQVQKQCEALQPTVADREEQRWRVSVLEASECPERVHSPAASAAATKAKSPKTLPEGEESLSSDDGLADFISDDEDDASVAASRPSGVPSIGPREARPPRPKRQELHSDGVSPADMFADAADSSSEQPAPPTITLKESVRPISSTDRRPSAASPSKARALPPPEYTSENSGHPPTATDLAAQSEHPSRAVEAAAVASTTADEQAAVLPPAETSKTRPKPTSATAITPSGITASTSQDQDLLAAPDTNLTAQPSRPLNSLTATDNGSQATDTNDDEDDIRAALQRISRKYECTVPLLTLGQTLPPSSSAEPPLPSAPSNPSATEDKPAAAGRPQTAKSGRQPPSRLQLLDSDVIDLTLDDDEDTPPPAAPQSQIPSSSAPQMKSRGVTDDTSSHTAAPDKPPNPDKAMESSNELQRPTAPDTEQAKGSQSPGSLGRSRLPKTNKQAASTREFMLPIMLDLTPAQRRSLDALFGTAQYKVKDFKRDLAIGLKQLRDRQAGSDKTLLKGKELLVALLTSCFNNKSYVRPGPPVQVPLKSAQQAISAKSIRLKKFMKTILRCLEAAAQQHGVAAPIETEPSSDPDYDGDDAESTHLAKRKRKVQQSAEALMIQKSAQRRVEDQTRQQRRLAKKLERMGVSNEDPERQAVSFAPEIYLHPHIGGRVKPHQLKGVQFLFREIVHDKRRQGALLAHTMGLGKTMQVISLLVTIALAGASEDARIQKVIPVELRQSRTLVLCPSSLIENWWEECLMWVPQDDHTQSLVGPVRKITSVTAPEDRVETIGDWYRDSGILLLSYDLFRDFVFDKKNRLGPDHATVRQQLLDGPNIIVADEAHKFKNRSTGLSAACSQFRSTSRIALTGSPLSNHLEDYFAMIDWIAPRYLGDFVQFKAKYMEPIEDGLYVDSTPAEKRLSLRRLAVLKKDLDPKVDRADISAISDDLPPKTEFVVTVPLTEIQKQAYNTYIESLLTGKVDDVAQTKLWDWLSILSLLCNHPACFLKKLEDRHGKLDEDVVMADATEDTVGEDKSAGSDIEEVESTAVASADRAVSEMPATATARLQQLCRSVFDLSSVTNSYRMQAVEMIVQESTVIGDKVLIFSHSIPTLNYLETMLGNSDISFSRLDGATPIHVRQAATKEFNQEDSTIQVYLISMRAGGLGLNIPGANRVIILDFGFNPSWEEQAVGRAYRLGQKKPVYVYRFLAGGTYETIIHNKAVFKTQLSSRVVDKRAPVSWATKSNRDYLFPVKDVPRMEEFDTFAGKDAVIDKMWAKDIIRNLELTETFQKEANEVLTPEEQNQVEAEYAEQQLMRNDPEAYRRKMMEAATLRPHEHAASLSISSAIPPAASSGPTGLIHVPAHPQQAGRTWVVSTPADVQPLPARPPAASLPVPDASLLPMLMTAPPPPPTSAASAGAPPQDAPAASAGGTVSSAIATPQSQPAGDTMATQIVIDP